MARSLANELAREIGHPGHSLHGVAGLAVGRRRANDDVAYLLGDGRLALVHLTWRRTPEDQPMWPATSIYASVAAFLAAETGDDGDER